MLFGLERLSDGETSKRMRLKVFDRFLVSMASRTCSACLERKVVNKESLGSLPQLNSLSGILSKQGKSHVLCLFDRKVVNKESLGSLSQLNSFSGTL